MFLGSRYDVFVFTCWSCWLFSGGAVASSKVVYPENQRKMSWFVLCTDEEDGKRNNDLFLQEQHAKHHQGIICTIGEVNATSLPTQTQRVDKEPLV